MNEKQYEDEISYISMANVDKLDIETFHIFQLQQSQIQKIHSAVVLKYLKNYKFDQVHQNQIEQKWAYFEISQNQKLT